MKTLTLFTTGYQSILKNFLAGKHYIEETAPDENFLHSMGLAEGVYNLRDCGLDALAVFLEYIAILEHPVYRHSSKLTQMALELQNTAIHAANIQNLSDYTRENNTLHIEGYTAFRMGEYRMKLDLMMYYVVKKLKLYS